VIVSPCKDTQNRNMRIVRFVDSSRFEMVRGQRRCKHECGTWGGITNDLGGTRMGTQQGKSAMKTKASSKMYASLSPTAVSVALRYFSDPPLELHLAECLGDIVDTWGRSRRGTRGLTTGHRRIDGGEVRRGSRWWGGIRERSGRG